ncbi:MAG: complex I NDUFA9 subunit family protein [Wenzhouxiangellaceae bacterium]|nr:complex I NDUFA9 subunit family protein [Wenzhouxiangellaceae bacterium]
MKILILGGSGFVGRHLARRLSRAGHAITVVTRHKPAARQLEIVPRLKLVQFDPYDEQLLAAALDRHDALINLIGILNERGSDGSGFYRAHVELVETAIAACSQKGVRRFIQMSALNAGRGESFYLKTRGQAEQRVRESGLDWTIFRPSVIFGRDDSFLNRFSTLLKVSPLLPLARPDARLSPAFIDDVVEAFMRVLELRENLSETYELCGAEVWKLKELVDWIAEQRKLKRVVIGLPDALGRLQARIFDLVPGKPFSTDNFKSLQLDSVCTDNGFERLGIDPWGVSEKAPEWLDPNDRNVRYQRYRSARTW